MNPGRLAPPVCNTQCQQCQMAVVTATYQKCGSFTSWMSVENWWPLKWPAVSHGVRKQATAGMLATARIPAATGTPTVSKGHQQQSDMFGKPKKVSGKEARNMAVECGSDNNNLVAVVFARSGSKGSQGSGNTAQCTYV
jgi:hypothetical protein